MAHPVSPIPTVSTSSFHLTAEEYTFRWCMCHLLQVATLKTQSYLLFDFRKTALRRINFYKAFRKILSSTFLSCSSSIVMSAPETVGNKDVYSVWALPSEDVGARIKNLMDGLRSEFGGPQFEPHVTVVGAISLTADDALAKFKSACDGLKAYNATVDSVATGTFFYQCVYLLLRPTPEVMEAGAHCSSHFSYQRTSPYMPHLSLIYGDLADEEKKKAQEKGNLLDKEIGSLSFQISRLALCKTDTEDRTCKSWEKVAECNLSPN